MHERRADGEHGRDRHDDEDEPPTPRHPGSRAGRESEHHWKHTPPDAGQRTAIHPQHVGIERDFNQHKRRIEDAVGEKQQRERHGDSREPVAKGAVDGRGEERDEGERDYLRGHCRSDFVLEASRTRKTMTSTGVFLNAHARCAHRTKSRELCEDENKPID